METALDNTIYIINDENEVEQVTYRDVVYDYVETTTTPRGIGPVYFREGAEIYKWVAGGRKHLVSEEDTEEEAQARLDAWMIADFESHPSAPMAYSSWDDAEYEACMMQEGAA